MYGVLSFSEVEMGIFRDEDEVHSWVYTLLGYVGYALGVAIVFYAHDHNLLVLLLAGGSAASYLLTKYNRQVWYYKNNLFPLMLTLFDGIARSAAFCAALKLLFNFFK